jgi:hypothetical protein
MRPTRHVAPLIATIALCAACTTSANKRDQAIIPTGAERWQRADLLLPADSPLVVELRAELAISALDRLHAWLIAEPGMFGEGGEELTRALITLRGALVEIAMGDPFTTSTWAGYGLKLDEPWLLGLAPAPSAQVAEADALLAKLLNTPPERDLDDALLDFDAERAPLGLFAQLSAALRNAQPVQGVRLVLPVADSQRLLNTLDRLLGKQFTITANINTPSAPDSLVRVYQREGALATLRLIDDHAVLDLSIPKTSLPIDQITPASFTPPGRPAAPRASGVPTLAISLDQRGFAQVARLNMYLDALRSANSEAAASRDARLIDALQIALHGYHQWSPDPALPLSGVSYALYLDPSGKTFLRAQTSLFAPRSLDLPQPSPPAPSLNLNSRGLAAALNRDTILGKDSRWLQWLSIPKFSRIAAFLEDDESESSANIVFLLALPKNFALLLANSVNLAIEEAPPLRFTPAYVQHERFTRVEIAARDEDLHSMLAAPRALSLITLEPSLSPLERDAASAALRATVTQLATLGDDEVQAEIATRTPLTPQRASTIDPQGPLSQISYFYQREGTHPWILIGYQIPPEALAQEVGKLNQTQTTHAALIRVEPVSLLRAASTFTPKQLSWLDLPTLAQRIGALTLRMTASEPDHALIYSIELERPLDLQQP